MEDDEKTVPYSRFEKKTAEVNALKTAMAEMQKQLEESQTAAGRVADLQARFEQLKAETDAERQTHRVTLSLSRAGVNAAETADLVRWRFGKSGKSPDEFDTWLKDDAPGDKLLDNVFVKPTPAPEPTVDAAPPRTVTPQPPVNGGTRPVPPPRDSHSIDSVQNMTTDELRENYADIMKTWGFQGHDFSKR